MTPSVSFWSQVTGTSLSPWRSDGRFATFVPADGDAHLRVQRVDDGPGGVHLDLHVDVVGSPLLDVATRAAGLGARVLHEGDGFVLLRSPGGFAFCLVQWRGERRVPPAAGPVPVLVDQLCRDVPARLWGAECGFWSAFTGWGCCPARCLGSSASTWVGLDHAARPRRVRLLPHRPRPRDGTPDRRLTTIRPPGALNG